MSIITLLAQALLTPSDIGLPQTSGGLDGVVGKIIAIVYTVVGILSTIWLIVGAVKYVLSGGDSAGIKSAKETITYALAGLVVALLAFGIVNFITSRAGGL
jgi:hypothetical protein